MCLWIDLGLSLGGWIALCLFVLFVDLDLDLDALADLISILFKLLDDSADAFKGGLKIEDNAEVGGGVEAGLEL